MTDRVDKIKFFKVSALLKSFKGNLPKGNIDLNHVEDYHSYLTSLQEIIRVDLSEFRIPKSAIKERAIPHSVSVDEWGNVYGTPYTYHPYCDGDAFRRHLDAVLQFIETYMQDLTASLKADRKNG